LALVLMLVLVLVVKRIYRAGSTRLLWAADIGVGEATRQGILRV